MREADERYQRLVDEVRLAVANCIHERYILDVAAVTSTIADNHPEANPGLIEDEVVAAGLGGAVPMKLGETPQENRSSNTGSRAAGEIDSERTPAP